MINSLQTHTPTWLIAACVHSFDTQMFFYCAVRKEYVNLVLYCTPDDTFTDSPHCPLDSMSGDFLFWIYEMQ